jgi:hypothetical protein
MLVVCWHPGRQQIRYALAVGPPVSFPQQPANRHAQVPVQNSHGRILPSVPPVGFRDKIEKCRARRDERFNQKQAQIVTQFHGFARLMKCQPGPKTLHGFLVPKFVMSLRHFAVQAQRSANDDAFNPLCQPFVQPGGNRQMKEVVVNQLVSDDRFGRIDKMKWHRDMRITASGNKHSGRSVVGSVRVKMGNVGVIVVRIAQRPTIPVCRKRRAGPVCRFARQSPPGSFPRRPAARH